MKYDLNVLLRHNVNNQIVKALEKNEIPWQKPWKGHGKGVGFPKNVLTKKKFFGVDVILLQMAAKRKGFVNKWWGTREQFSHFGLSVKERPANVEPGDWGTEIVFYKTDNNCKNNVATTSIIVYNAEQLVECPEEFQADAGRFPSYKLSETILHGTAAKLEYSDDGAAFYFYPPDDFIMIPKKKYFES